MSATKSTKENNSLHIVLYFLLKLLSPKIFFISYLNAPFFTIVTKTLPSQNAWDNTPSSFFTPDPSLSLISFSPAVYSSTYVPKSSIAGPLVLLFYTPPSLLLLTTPKSFFQDQTSSWSFRYAFSTDCHTHLPGGNSGTPNFKFKNQTHDFLQSPCLCLALSLLPIFSIPVSLKLSAISGRLFSLNSLCIWFWFHHLSFFLQFIPWVIHPKHWFST